MEPGQPRTVRQAAAELNVSQGTIRAWIIQRRLGFVRLGRAVRVPSAEIKRLLDTGFVPAEQREIRNVAVSQIRRPVGQNRDGARADPSGLGPRFGAGSR
jgi:excisionase family DNA binding protein